MNGGANEPAIRMRGVEKRFGSVHAVRELDLDVPRGSLCGFLGPNGAGKSTTIRMIMSIIYPDAGRVEVLGGSALQSKNRIGYLPEERGLYRKMRVGEFLEFVGRLKGVARTDLETRIGDWLERLELPDVQRRRCQELSKGMQQKIQFLAAIIHEPELLILDEPFSGLDPVNAALLNTIIRDLHDAGTTIIFSTHVLHQAERICDRIFLINHGVKLLDATMEEIRDRFDPRTILVQPIDGATDLEVVAGVKTARPHGEDGALEIELGPDQDPQTVMRRVMEHGPLRSIELRRLTLDEVFVRLVARDEGDAAAERAREQLTHA
jgi:ABC-2 type transport system ATP-binding protein